MDPLSLNILAGTIIEAASRLGTYYADREALLKELMRDAALQGFPKIERAVLAEWLTEPRVQALLRAGLSDHAASSLKLRFEQVCVSVDDPVIRDIVKKSRTAIIDQRPPSRAIREEMADVKDLLRDSSRPHGKLPPDVAYEMASLDVVDSRLLREWLLAEPAPSLRGFQQLAESGGLLTGMGVAAWRSAARAAAARGYREVAHELWKGAALMSPTPELEDPWVALEANAADLGDVAKELAKALLAREQPSRLEVVVGNMLTEEWQAIANLPVPNGDSPTDEFVVRIIAAALHNVGREREAETLISELAARSAGASAKEQLAGVLLARTAQRRTTDRTADLNRAQDEATQAVRRRLTWRSPPGRAFDVAVQAAFLSDDLAAIRRLIEDLRQHAVALPLDDGDTVRFCALAIRRFDGDEADLSEVPEGVQRWVALIGRDGHDEADIRELEDLLGSEEDWNQRLQILIMLATVDRAPDEAINKLAEKHPGAAHAVRAAVYLVREEPEKALLEAREAAVSPGMSAQSLALVMARLEAYADLARLARQTWDSERDAAIVDFALGATGHIRANEDMDDALDELRDVAQAALRSDGLSATQRQSLNRGLFHSSVNRSRWPDAERDGQALLQCDLDDGEARHIRWVMAQVLINLGHPRKAWNVVQGPGAELLAPQSSLQASTLGGLTLSFSTDPGHVQELLTHVDLSDEGSAAALLLPAWMLSMRLPNEPEGRRIYELLREFMDRYPENSVVYSKSVDELLDPESGDFLQTPIPPALERASRAAGWGRITPRVLLQVSPKTFAAMIVESLGTYVFSGSSSLVTRQLDASAADRAIDDGALLDTTAIHVLALMDHELQAAGHDALASKLLRSLRHVQTTPEIALDIGAALAARAPDSGHSVLSPGTSTDPRPSMTEVPPERVQKTGALMQRMESLIDGLDRTAAVEFDDDDDIHDSPNVQTAASAEMAARRDGHIVWMDDGAGRDDLRPQVRTFGIGSLLRALLERGLLSEDEHARAADALDAAGVVLLPDSAEGLLERARAVNFDLGHGSAGAVLTPGWWVPSNTTGGHIEALVSEAILSQSGAGHGWLYRMMAGMCAKYGPATAARVVFHVMVSHPQEMDEGDLADLWQGAVEHETGRMPQLNELGEAAKRLEADVTATFGPVFRTRLEAAVGAPVWSDE